MGLVDTCKNLEAVYEQHQVKQPCNRFEFLAHLASVNFGPENLTTDALVKMKLLSQQLQSSLEKQTDAEAMEAIQKVSNLLSTAYEVYCAVLEDGLTLEHTFFTDSNAVDSFEGVMEFFEDYQQMKSLDTSALEEPYRVLCGDNLLMLSYYDAEGNLSILYPKPENHSFKSLITSNSIFITNLEDLKELSKLLLSLSKEGPDEAFRAYYTKNFRCLHQAISQVDVMDSLLVFKGSDGRTNISGLPVKITKPRKVNEFLAKSSFIEPVTQHKCNAWILG